MKYCPICHEVYSEQLQFCLRDGTPLIEDMSDEGPETQFRTNPFVIDVSEKASIPDSETAMHTTPVAKEQKDSASRPFFLLFIGIVMGGFLVLVTVVVMNSLSARGSETSPNLSINTNQSKPSNIDTSANEANNSDENNVLATSDLSDDTNSNISEEAESTKAETVEKPRKSAGSLKKKGYNGRVIMMNAIVRAAPSIYAPELDIASFDEPIKIGKSAGGNNPWFRVTTAKGTTGWMHGNTIEFIR